MGCARRRRTVEISLHFLWKTIDLLPLIEERNSMTAFAAPPGAVVLADPLRKAVLSELQASEAGLSTEEARRRLALRGPNDPIPERHRGFTRQALAQLANPLALILLLAAAVSAVLGEPANAGIIAGVVLLSAALNLFQTYRSDQAVQRLRSGVAPSTLVLRDGVWKRLPSRDLVPGDIIRLGPGDLVPADARLLWSRRLHVQQATLTGESLPVEKSAGAGDGPAFDRTSTDATERVFQGTSVVSGTAEAVVTETGPETAFGSVAGLVAAKPPETEFDRSARAFGLFITRTVLALVLVVLLMNIAARRDALESLLFAVALAVGLTPEFLPMIVTVTLAQGALRMARQRVIVKNLSSLQNFGSIDILCSDKTGTLTTGEMSLAASVDAGGHQSDRVLQLAHLNCLRDEEGDAAAADPLDAAVLRAGHPDIAGWRTVGEVPFDFERRRASTVVQRDGERLLVTKGAPESVLACCDAIEVNGTPQPLDEDALRRVEGVYHAMGEAGQRALAVAWRSVPLRERYDVQDEAGLTLAGLLAFADPPLEDADEMLAALRQDGVHIRILTGDSEVVARAVCARVGLDVRRIVRGEEIDKLSPTALGHLAERTTVFARVSPAQKDRIILALKARRHVVGFLGDGVNDAPSLHAADVGISVANGVEVAKDAADIILLERSLQALHRGILEGRHALANVMKYLLMGTSSNFGNMFSMAGAALFLPFLPMLPTQILLNNFLYDLAQVTIPTDNVDPGFLRRPRRWDLRLVRRFMIYIGPISSIYDFLTFWVLLRMLHASEQLFHTGWFVESLATQTLVLFVIRTAGNPLRSPPSLPLTITTLLVVAVGSLLPVTPLGPPLGFVPLPRAFYGFLVGATATYLALVEVAKRRLIGRHNHAA